MIIKAVSLNADRVAQWALQPVHMHRLGQVVALAGRNGSGKSRVLEAVEHYAMQRNSYIGMYTEDVGEVPKLQGLLNSDPANPARVHWEANLANRRERIDLVRCLEISGDAVLRPIRFVPKKLELADPSQATNATLLSRFMQTKNVSINELQDTALSYIQQTQNRFWNATHQNYSGDVEARRHAVSDYERLQGLLQSFVGKTITRSVDDVAQIFGKDLATARLSDGQKILLQLCVAIHAQGDSIGNGFLILDEVENHLHPSVVIDVMETIMKVAPQVQVWLATHSVPLLAYVLSRDPMALWFVNDGSIAHAGRNPKVVMDSLLGGEERIAQLHAFTGLPAQLAALNYASESLAPPTVLPFSESDPQVSQIRRIISQLRGDGPLRVLDFGAGKGRLLEGLAALSDDIRVNELVSYYALDSSLDDAPHCVAAIEQWFPSEPPRHFHSIDALTGAVGDGYFDLIVMCNVLHEVTPLAWGELFSETSALMRLLGSDGYLLVVEDLRIPTGEKAHEFGFLVFDTQHLRTLFSIDQADVAQHSFVCSDARGDGRLKAHLISRRCLIRYSSTSRNEAIRQLGETAVRRIQELRSQPATYVNGMSNGFWTQQFANAALFLRTI